MVDERATQGKTGWRGWMTGNPGKAAVVLLGIGLVSGILFWGGLNTAMEWTNRTEFCISCHELSVPYEEYKKTVHYSNRTGTTVACPDCHVAGTKTPGDYMRKVTRKIQAANDVWQHWAGAIDTPEKFEAKRLELAKRVWAGMKAADSRECRNCHKFETMDKSKQKLRSTRKHQEAVEDRKTCIDCHKGLVHKPVHIGLDSEESKDTAADNATKDARTANEPQTPPDTRTAGEGLAAKAATPVVVGTPSAAGTPPVPDAGAAKPVRAASDRSKVGPEASPTPANATATVIDWSKAPVKSIPMFYPGQAGLEWVLNKTEHSSVTQILEKNRTCIYCHDEDASDIGNKIIAGMPVGSAKAPVDATPPKGKAGSMPMKVQAAHDGSKIYLRLEWDGATGEVGEKMDPLNETKVAMMLDAGLVEGAGQYACWATCHMDLRSMPDAVADSTAHPKAKMLGWENGVTKYIRESRGALEMKNKPRGAWNKFKPDAGITAALREGKFLDLIQYRSGKGQKAVDGHVLDARYMKGGKSLIGAEGKRDGKTWVVTFERTLAGIGAGDHTLAAGKTYSVGFAIHADHASARFHHVSLGYSLALDNDKADINVVKQ